MQAVSHLARETKFIQSLRLHLNVVIPATIFLVKILIQIFSRDNIKEIIRSFSNLPLEIMLIAMSFMLGALSGLSENYISGFNSQSDADVYAAIVIIFIFLVSLFINWISRFAMLLMEKLFIAIKQYRDYQQFTSQPVLPESVPNMATGGRIIWAMVYCIFMVMLLLLSLVISVSVLAYVLHLIQ